jgi:hypothetical protein
VVDLYGKTGRFDVIAITDHILMKRDCWRARAGMRSLGRRSSRSPRSVSRVLDEIAARRSAPGSSTTAGDPGAEITQNHIRSSKNSHIVALNITEFISADQPPRTSCARFAAGRAEHRLPSASSDDAAVEIGTCYLWDHRKRLVDLVDVWEAANRDDLFSVTSLKHYPYVANSDFHKPKHLYSWKTLLRCEKNWEAIRAALRTNVDVALTLYRNGSWAA